MTALHAASNGQDEIVQLLLAKSEIDINKPMNNGETALLLASNLGYAKVVELLLSKSDEIDINKCDDIIGGTPLYSAATQNHVLIVELLMVCVRKKQRVVSFGLGKTLICVV